MSRLPKKKSRPITIDGRKFRWMLHGKNKYIGRAPGGVTISIQEDLEHPGITLQCTAFSVQYEEAEEECGGCDTSIFPSDIEKNHSSRLGSWLGSYRGARNISSWQIETGTIRS